jgi:hypothetical protein
VGIYNSLSEGIETPRRCLDIPSVHSYQSSPCALGGDILSVECVNGDSKGPASGRRGGPIRKVNLSCALDPGPSGGREWAPPLPLLKGSPGSFSASLVLWWVVAPSPAEEVYLGASSRFIFGALSCREGVISARKGSLQGVF